MPILYQKFIFRADLRANPNVLYLFGDNLKRAGLGGQAKEMRGEPNAVGIATKKFPHMGDHAYFNDADYVVNCAGIDVDLNPAYNAVRLGQLVVIPLDGLGTGLSELPERAPRTNAYLVNQLEYLSEIG
jgi:hypothetical protein